MNYDKLIKLRMMTTSSHDGECLNAIRMERSAKSSKEIRCLFYGLSSSLSFSSSLVAYSVDGRALIERIDLGYPQKSSFLIQLSHCAEPRMCALILGQ